MKSILPCFLILTLVSCVQWKEPAVQQQIIYTNSWQQEWIAEKLEQCQEEAVILNLAGYEAKGRTQSKEEVQEMGRFILWSCYKHFRIMI